MKSMRYCSRRQCQGTPGRCVDPCTNNVETGNQHFWTSARLLLRHVKSDIFLFWYHDMKAGPRVAEARLARRLDTRRSAPAPGITLWGTATLTFTEISGSISGRSVCVLSPFHPRGSLPAKSVRSQCLLWVVFPEISSNSEYEIDMISVHFQNIYLSI